MKRWAWLLIFFAATAKAEEASLTLEQCFQETLEQSESLAIQDESIRIAQAQYQQALGSVLPHLALQASNRFQDTVNDGSNGTVSSTFTRSSTPEAAITVTQPLFQGLREFQSLKIAHAEEKRTSLEKDRATQLLYLDVAQAYITTLKLEKDLEILNEIQQTLHQRLQELQERIRLGKSRESEILSIRSELARTKGEIEKTRGLAQSARDLLSFFRGKETDEPLVDEITTPAEIPSAESFLAPLPFRSDLQAIEQEVEIAQGRLLYEKGARWPTVDLGGNYYLYRVGFWEDIDWDVTLSLNLPLYYGGEIKGRIREAQATLRQAELARREALRRGDLEVRQVYNNWTASEALKKSLEESESYAASDYQSHVKEYRDGWVNNLDVLQALRDWQERQREWNGAFFQTKLDYLQLKVATGEVL
ncbi:MAG: TolC family protein [Deltaproteobacteria bacterium]|nr:TolC family protein [Deltaproteobacteria bacterium]